MPVQSSLSKNNAAAPERNPSSLRRRRPAAALLAATISLAGAEGAAAQDCATGPTVGAAPANVATAQESYRNVLSRAQAFSAALSDRQREQLLQSYSFANAARWHTYPEWSFRAGRGRLGLRLDTLNDAQWQALFDLLEAATGSGRNQGFDELQQHLIADDYLNRIGINPGYGRGDFKIAFLGEPTQSGLWQLQFGGHHFALTNTYCGGVLIGATPSFRGIEPLAPFEFDGTTYAPQRDEHEAFRALLASLSPDQLQRTRISGLFRDVVMMAGNDWNFPTQRQGIPASDLTPDQRDLLLEVIALHVHDVDDVSAAMYMARYRDGLEEALLQNSWPAGFTSRIQ